ncbi:protein DpdG [Paenibacillus sp. NPDC058174]|uniref:protein DpdG n=1 Tax=Paenibacillus sp. NPDC058174 TaxID=3346366 RepID=UPI0036DF534C
MSLIKTPEASPARIYAIYALMAQMHGQRLEIDSLKKMIMPAAFASPNSERTETDFIGKTIPEMISLGLMKQENNFLEITDTSISKGSLSFEVAIQLPHVIRKRALVSEEGQNEDLGRIIAWYLTQNPYRAPGSWKEVEEALLKQLKDKMECSSDARYGQFEDWSLYLGFTTRIWKQLMPDPTKVIRHLLPELFHDSRTHFIDTIVHRLAKLCPVFEHGSYREKMKNTYGTEALLAGHLSQTTSFAWLRLQDEGVVDLRMRSDADVYILTVQEQKHRYSEITWNGKEDEI